MLSAGFEPARISTFGPKPNPLDHSGKIANDSASGI